MTDADDPAGESEKRPRTTDKQLIAQRVRALRTAFGFTQAEVALRAERGWRRENVVILEGSGNGNAASSWNQRVGLARAFGVTVEDIEDYLEGDLSLDRVLQMSTARVPPAEPTFGQRLIAAVVPRFWKDLAALQHASGRSLTTINEWSTGKSNPRLEHVEDIARLVEQQHGVRISALELLRDRAPTIVREDRYPSRGDVLAAFSAFASQKAIERVASQANFGARDPGPLYWIEAVVRAQRDVELEQGAGAQPGDERGAAAFAAFAREDAARADVARSETEAAIKKRRES